MELLATSAAKDQKSLLICWKDHSNKFPFLLFMAKDYLSNSALSCASEQTFSSAANFCSRGCGSLKAQTIARCVSSCMWLKQHCKKNLLNCL
ncbi:hypothetical protein VP01_8819g1, partial [Puccinia sorghi]